MIQFHRLFRLAGLIILIFLACVGVGLAGPVPVSSRNRNVLEAQKDKTEQVEKTLQDARAFHAGEVRA